jgi:hypothetical protein
LAPLTVTFVTITSVRVILVNSICEPPA